MGTNLRVCFAVLVACSSGFAGPPEESLLRACARGDLPAAAARLRAGEDANQTGDDQETPLLLAARQGNAALMRLLLDAGATPGARRWNGETLLHAAVSSGHREAVEVALDRGIGVDETDHRRGQTALHYAAGDGRTEIVQLLIKHGAVVDARSKGGVTPLWLAAQGSHWKTMEVLLAAGANAAAESTGGYRPIHMAARSCQAPVLAVLLGAGVDVKGADPAGMTPLHLAVSQSCLPAIQALLRAGADLDAKDAHGQTARDFARRRRMKEILAFLDEWKAAHSNQEQSAEK